MFVQETTGILYYCFVDGGWGGCEIDGVVDFCVPNFVLQSHICNEHCAGS